MEFERYGLLVMDEDRTEVLLWLLDKDGRTNGPVWASTMTSETAVAAAAEVVRVMKAVPDVATFTARPPKGRDMAREDALNALWRGFGRGSTNSNSQRGMKVTSRQQSRPLSVTSMTWRVPIGNAIAEFAWALSRSKRLIRFAGRPEADIAGDDFEP